MLLNKDEVIAAISGVVGLAIIVITIIWVIL